MHHLYRQSDRCAAWPDIQADVASTHTLILKSILLSGQGLPDMIPVGTISGKLAGQTRVSRLPVSEWIAHSVDQHR